MSAGPALKEGTAMGVPAFRRLWGAGLISDAGDWLMFIALPLVVLQLTGSAVGTSLAFLLELIPPVLLAPVVARVVDRLPHRRVMLVAMLAQAVTLLPLLTVHDRSDLHVVYGVIVAQAVFAAFFEPAKSSLLPTLVGPERVTSANALVGLNNNVGRIIGGPLGGVLLAMGGISVVALADIGTYLVAAALVLSLPRREAAPAERLSLTRQEGTPRRKAAPGPLHQGGGTRGILGALADPATRALIVVDVAASIAQGLFVVLFVFFVTDVINGTAADVGLLRGVQAVGAILAGTVLGVLGARLNLLRLTLAGVVTFTVVTAITWNLSFVTHAVPVYAVLFAAMGVPAVFMGAGLTSLIQRAAAGTRRGSAFAALGLGQAVGQAIGLLAAGLLHDSVGTLPLLEVQAGAYAAAAVLAVVLLPRTTRPADGQPCCSDRAPTPPSPRRSG
ncbi:MFS transporter [Winogradskya humida]|uniref:MFS transporter n=1 Tax=Winogradskya humida TaxID=113566 RepID=A0ABQ3ZF96_9ACTN|nr:MFS transporter [Actinoplanes humidus]GIE17245.1 MFS transporter [Actinoplanes humidus]